MDSAVVLLEVQKRLQGPKNPIFFLKEGHRKYVTSGMYKSSPMKEEQHILKKIWKKDLPNSRARFMSH